MCSGAEKSSFCSQENKIKPEANPSPNPNSKAEACSSCRTNKTVANAYTYDDAYDDADADFAGRNTAVV
jgi:hypothetical protein